MKMIHNKKRNTAFLFETLVQEMTKAVIKKDENKKDTAASIIKEFFRKATALKKELDLYKEVRDAKGLPKKLAERVLSEAKHEYERLDPKQIFNEQTKLINKINKMLSKNVFDNYVPNYKSLASIYQIFNKTLPIKSRVLLEAKVVNLMTRGSENKDQEEAPITTPVLKIFTSKFKSTYKHLLEEQQMLLHHYVGSVKDNGLELKTFINEEIYRIKEEITAYSVKENNKEDSLVQEKTKKLMGVIDDFRGQYISEEMLSKLLKLQKLINEMKKDG